MVPAHLTLKTAVQILLRREGDAGITAAFTASSSLAELADLTVEQAYEELLGDSE